MSNSVYRINKGINRPIEFKGLKGQYIWYFGGGVITLLLLFAIFYASGLPLFACMGLILAAGTLMTHKLYQLSNTYGPDGLMKKLAARRVPRVVRVDSRTVFRQLAGGRAPLPRGTAGKHHTRTRR
ncbi:MAG: DUF4133 domain-containing protein [Hymenobacteraceae bacterium]|nr:DUF4133 domain-containing protein [Hymenobacteraceae bacterium]MDX5481965.1 DUF4133 domain-containing protein [Hymenobacteraceae bacterium]